MNAKDARTSAIDLALTSAKLNTSATRRGENATVALNALTIAVVYVGDAIRDSSEIVARALLSARPEAPPAPAAQSPTCLRCRYPGDPTHPNGDQQ